MRCTYEGDCNLEKAVCKCFFKIINKTIVDISLKQYSDLFKDKSLFQYIYSLANSAAFRASFSAFFRSRNARKKSLKICPHCSAKTPSVTSHS